MGLIRRREAPIAAENAFICLDFDTLVMGNSVITKEWVGRTHQGVDGRVNAYCGLALERRLVGWIPHRCDL